MRVNRARLVRTKHWIWQGVEAAILLLFSAAVIAACTWIGAQIAQGAVFQPQPVNLFSNRALDLEVDLEVLVQVLIGTGVAVMCAWMAFSLLGCFLCDRLFPSLEEVAAACNEGRFAQAQLAAQSLRAPEEDRKLRRYYDQLQRDITCVETVSLKIHRFWTGVPMMSAVAFLSILGTLHVVDMGCVEVWLVFGAWGMVTLLAWGARLENGLLALATGIDGAHHALGRTESLAWGMRNAWADISEWLRRLVQDVA
ncbi:hypothetical protein [Oecophyllibacter saccharovorans]|uniref:Uncharacterized protein n=1 Tax=Oecophyllibacter saccharovorans TaxID=2558360 RepID=A0A506UKL1_9PROT|nr:hypothetical protein [Oecophyllibacter saccharovorans]TPW33858.1 hypothetical protein E3202_04490 [Oecophyllibacter saccharovorans]